MSFPSRNYSGISSYAADYFKECVKSSQEIPADALSKAMEALIATYKLGRVVYVCGNGGSASIANHLVCDHMKGIQAGTKLVPRVISLATNIEIISAIANDMHYDDIFLYQLKSLAKPGDLLVTISASGDSENVVRALQWASKNDVRTIALTGFGGGRSAELSDINLHVGGTNYGVIEDVHQSIMHILAQFIRQGEMDSEEIQGEKF